MEADVTPKIYMKDLPKTFDPIPECFRWIILDHRLVGAANIIYAEDAMVILNFEIFEPGRGYGRAVIEMFKEDQIILGAVTPSSRGFWEHMGAVIVKDGQFMIQKKPRKEVL